MAESAVSSCSAGSSSILHNDEGSANKRKLVDHPLQDTISTSPSLTEFPPYKPLEESWSQQSDIKTFELPPGFVPEQWDGILIRQLEDLLLENLTSIFQDAIKHIVSFGYNEVVAQRAISRHGLYGKGEDLVLNIVNDTVAFLQRGKDVNSTSVVDQCRDFVFENVQQLAEFTLLEMIHVLKENKPSLSTVESMWWLLLCDLNISQACAVEEREILNGCLSSIYRKFSSLPVSSSFFEDQRCKPRYFNPNVPSGFASSTCVAQNCPPEAPEFESLPKTPDAGNHLSCKLQTIEKKVHASMPGNSNRIQSDTTSQRSSSKGKLKNNLKMLNKKEYISRQKSIIEEFTQLASDSGKSSGTFGFVMEKKLKSKSADTNTSTAQPKAKVEAPSPGKIHQIPKKISSATHEPPMPKAPIKITTKVEACGSSKARFKVTTQKPGTNFSALSDISAAACGSSNAHVKVTSSNPEVKSLTLPNLSTDTGVNMNASKSQSNSRALSNTYATCESPKPRTKVATIKPGTNSPTTPDISATSNPEGNCMTFLDICNYYAHIPYDKSQGICIPRDERDEIILKLVPRVQKLQNELCSWTEWANQKVMQAAHRLIKENVELNALRQEKEEVEKFKREKQMLDENTTKRLLEMEAAVNNATGQVNKANITVEKLGVDNALIKKELINSKLFAAESEVRYQEALNREKKTFENAQLWEQQKYMLQEDLAIQKSKVAELQKKVEKAKGLQNRIEARLKEEMTTKETWNAHAASLKKEHEQLQVATKEEEAIIMEKAKIDVKRHEEDMLKLQNEISAMNLKFDALRIATLRKSIDEVYGTNDSNIANETSNAFKIIENFQGSFENEELSCDRECVMCLSNEMSVVFLPCAHMVLCTTCNELHEKQEMKNCPSCRATIDQRIPIRFSHQ